MVYDAEWWKKLKWRAIRTGCWAGKIWPQMAKPLVGLWTWDLKESNSWAKMSPNMRELFTVCTRVNSSWIEVNSCRKKYFGPKFVFPSCVQDLASHIWCYCIWLAVLSQLWNDSFQLLSIAEDLLTRLLTLLEDDILDTRIITCRVIMHMLNIAGTAMDQHRLYNMYPSLLKRLDDSNDNVRSVFSYTVVITQWSLIRC